MTPRRPPAGPRFDPWEIGLIVSTASIVAMVLVALVYRILSLLVGETLTQLVLALSGFLGFATTVVAAFISTNDRRHHEELRRQAEDEGRTL